MGSTVIGETLKFAGNLDLEVEGRTGGTQRKENGWVVAEFAKVRGGQLIV